MGNDVLSNVSDWIAIRLELMTNEPRRWVGFEHKGNWFKNAYYQLPTFDYYMQNCVNDKGGKYDFTKRRYCSHRETIKPMSERGFTDEKGGGSRILRHSIYMGTHFNFKEEWS